MGADTRLAELGVSRLGEVDDRAFSGLSERHRRELHVHRATLVDLPRLLVDTPTAFA